MNRRDQFLNDQDNLRRRAQKDHARKVDRDARGRQECYFSQQGQRDERIQANIADRDWARRNDEYKKSVFQTELHNARLEHRPPVYGSFLDVPDLERPKAKGDSGGSMDFIVIAILILCAIGGAVLNFLGGFLQIALLIIGIGYAGLTCVWAYMRHYANPTTPEAIARADAWNPIRITKGIIGFFRSFRSQPAAAPSPQFEQRDGQPQQPFRAPSQPHAQYFDQTPEPEVHQPQYFDPQSGQTRPPHQGV